MAELDRHIEQAVTLTHCEQDGDKVIIGFIIHAYIWVCWTC